MNPGLRSQDVAHVTMYLGGMLSWLSNDLNNIKRKQGYMITKHWNKITLHKKSHLMTLPKNWILFIQIGPKENVA